MAPISEYRIPFLLAGAVVDGIVELYHVTFGL